MEESSFTTPETERRIISFPQWQEALINTTLAAAQVAEYRREVFAFLRECKRQHAGASIMFARNYLAALSPQAAIRARPALRWWFKAAREIAPRPGGRLQPASAAPSASPRTDQAPLDHRESASRGHLVQRSRQSEAARPAAEDLGGADWERDLIRAARAKGLLFRTETTYREWAAKFAAFLQPRSPYAAAGEDIGAFLTEQAVTRRASPATQKQALNALVFVTKRPAVRAPRMVTLRSAAGQALTQTAA